MVTLYKLQEIQRVSPSPNQWETWHSGKRKNTRSRKLQDHNKSRWASFSQLQEEHVFQQTILLDKTITPMDKARQLYFYDDTFDDWEDDEDGDPCFNVNIEQKNDIRNKLSRKKNDKQNRREKKKSEWKNVKASKKRRKS